MPVKGLENASVTSPFSLDHTFPSLLSVIVLNTPLKHSNSLQVKLKWLFEKAKV